VSDMRDPHGAGDFHRRVARRAYQQVVKPVVEPDVFGTGIVALTWDTGWIFTPGVKTAVHGHKPL